MFQRTVGSVQVVVVFAFAGCATQNEQASMDTSVPAVDTPQSTPAPAASPPASSGASTAANSTPTDTVPLLATGCGGGVTGGGGGTFVTAAGGFYRYQRNGPPPNAKRELTFVRRDSAAAARLVAAAEDAGITRIRFSEPSNMTCHLTLDRAGTSYEVSWPMGNVPAAIRGLVSVAKDLEAAAAR